MAYTSPELVAAIIDVDDGDDVTPYIDTAGELVVEVCTNSGYSDERLELIERWLAAHFYDINRPRAKQEGINPGPLESFEDVKVDLGLRNTKYGQQALILDTAGNLAGLQNQQGSVKSGKSEAKWLGRRRCHGGGYY